MVMKWLEITVNAPPDSEEIVSNILLEAGATGVAIEGTNDNPVCEWDYAEELPEIPFSVRAYYSPDDDVKEAIENRLAATLGEADYEINSAVVEDENWLDGWKKFFKPVRCADHIVVAPTWGEYVPDRDDIVIEIDPGRAFGTGNHATTRMCLKMIEQYVCPKNTIVDVGTGSGVLSIAAAKMGAAPVFALEADEVAVGVAKSNMKLNSVDDRVTVIRSDLLSSLPDGVQADVMISNIVADVLIALAPDIYKGLRYNGLFIGSGIIEDRIEDVLSVFFENGLRALSVEQEGEWYAVTCLNKR